MDVLLRILFIIAFITSNGQSAKATTESLKKEPSQESGDKTGNHERFIQDLDDADWHIAHLKEAQFDGRRDCVESFADKARRYKEILKNDGALVMFVSSDPIPFNESDIFEDNCKVESIGQNNLKGFASQNTAQVTTAEHNQAVLEDARRTTQGVLNDTQSEMVIANLSSVTNPMDASNTAYQATTASMKPQFDSEEDANLNKKQKNSRRGEYMFSSIEYYDEVPDFDVSVCPDVVDAIDLQIDQLRAYDVECENMVEWHSLND